MFEAYSEISAVLTLTAAALLASFETDLTKSAAAAAVTKDFCEGETFRARCSYDEVIMIESAIYGRMRLDRCVKVDMGYLGCHEDVLDIADDKCSGRRRCDVTIPDPDFEKRRPCLELKSYLLVSYHCTKVSTADSNDCRIARYSPLPHLSHLPPATSFGQLASVLALETKCGSPERPWIIEVPHGQRINLTLVDFTARRSAPPPSPHPPPPPPPLGAGGAGAGRCVRYAKVMEKSADVEGDKSFVICGRSGRERSVYSSKGHVVRVVMEMDEENPNYFLIGYRAFGCADPVLPGDQFFIRADDDVGSIVIGCRQSTDRWRLTCRHDNNRWQGEAVVNCTSANVVNSEIIRASGEEKSPNAVLLAVLCVMFVFLLLLTILTSLLLYKRCRRQMRRHPFSDENRLRPAAAAAAASKAADESSEVVVTYVASESRHDTTSRTKYQRYGRHVTLHVDRRRRRRQQQQQQHHIYDSPITSSTENQSADRASEYERVETSGGAVGNFSHIWNRPLPRIPENR